MAETGKIIGIYSPVGRCGKTTLALALSELLARRSRVLYLSFEEFPALTQAPGNWEGEGLSDAVYHLQQGMLNAQKLRSMVREQRGFQLIPPFRLADDMTAGAPELLSRLLRTIQREMEAEVIVADMNSFAGIASELLDLCDIVYLPFTKDRISGEKVRAFNEYLELSGRKLLAARIIPLEMPEWKEKLQLTEDLPGSALFGPVGDLARELCSGLR